MKTQNELIEEIVGEFERYAVANLNDGGYPIPNNGRMVQLGYVIEIMQDFLRSALLRISDASIKDYEEKLWAACDTDEDANALARILYKAGVSGASVHT